MNETNVMAALYAALAKAQGQFVAIEKNRSVTIRPRDKAAYSFRYADLEEILSKTRPALSANGLALIQTINQGRLVCTLVHADGASVSSEVDMPAVREMGDPKAFGAAITYLRRYLVTAMLGVAADDDLDEDGEEMQGATPSPEAVKPQVEQPQRRRKEPKEDAQQASVTDRPVTVGEANYLKAKAAGRSLEELCDSAALPRVDSFEQLSLSGFNAIKAIL